MRLHLFYRPNIKYFLKVFTLLTLFFVANKKIIAQENLNEISVALNKGNVKILVKHFDQTIDLCFSDITQTYSKKQATLVLQKFFSKIEPNHFIILQKGKSNFNNTKYSIGKLSTASGEYKVYMFFILRNGAHYLKELRFEK